MDRKTMKIGGWLTSLAGSLLVFAMGCGEVSQLSIDVVFPTADVQNATRNLFFVVREVSTTAEPCSGLWEAAPLCEDVSGEVRPCAEYVKLVDYPNRDDVVAAPLDVAAYTVMVYAYGTDFDVICTEDKECAESMIGSYCRSFSSAVDTKACVATDGVVSPLAGACAGGVVSAGGATELTLALEPRPAN